MTTAYQQLAITKKGPYQHPVPPRRYELCMVFKHKTSRTVKFEESVEDDIFGGRQQLKEPTPDSKNKMQAWKQQREALLKQLKNCGLNIFCYYSRDRDDIFCKIGADVKKLQTTASRMKYKLQLKPEYQSAYAEYRQDVYAKTGNAKEHRFYSQIYQRHTDNLEAADEESMFTTRDKISLIHHTITSKDRDCAGIDLGQFMQQGGQQPEPLLQQYFPLHEDAKLKELTKDKWPNWIMMDTEHSHKVRDYFGDKVCFYYLWMSFYWKWLLIPGGVGATLQLLDVCFRTPDNITALPFCIFLSMWSVFLPHFWRRQAARYAIAWGTFDMAPDLEPCRPEHTGEPRINPVTAQVEPYYPWQKRMWQYMRSTVVILITGVILCLSILLLLFMRHKFKDNLSGGIASWQLIMAIFVEVGNVGLTWLAKWLTTLENHRTQSDHDIQLLSKVFVFKFLNSYFVLYYVAFFKRHAWLFGSPLQCIRDDCFLDLQVALAIFMIVRLIKQNCIRFFGPKFKLYMRSLRENNRTALHNFLNPSSRLELADISSAERQAKRERYDPFQDFDETLVTHGFATLFSVTSPWVCTATLLWTIGETVLDVRGLTDLTQRPLPLRMRNNEPWDTAFEIYGFLAMITNISAIVFASNEYSLWTFTEKLMLFAVLLHLVLCAKFVVKFVFPVVPQSVQLLHLKQESVVQRCLANVAVEPAQKMSQFMAEQADSFEIHEQDIMDEEDAAPEFSLRDSLRTMKDGFVGVLDKGLACMLCVTVVMTMLIAMVLFVYNHVGGRFT
jgi:hypothetical protein